MGGYVCRFGASLNAARSLYSSAVTPAVLLTLHATAIPTKKESSLAELKRGTLCRLRKPQPRTLSVALRAMKSIRKCRKPRSSVHLRLNKHNQCQLIDSRCVRDLAATKPRKNALGFTARGKTYRSSALVYPQGPPLYNSRPCRHSSVGRATAL